MNRFLALATTCTAALASIATSQYEPQWELSATTDGPAVALGTSGEATHTISVTLNEAGMSASGTATRIYANANACLEGASDAPVRLLLSLVGTDGAGSIVAQEVPACPDLTALEVHQFEHFLCGSGTECTVRVVAELERTGGAGGVVSVEWSATAFVSGNGDAAPEGAAASILVE